MLSTCAFAQGRFNCSTAAGQNLRSNLTNLQNAAKRAECQSEYETHHCETVKGGLGSADQGKVIRCDQPEQYQAGRVFYGCASGVISYFVDTAKFVVSLPGEVIDGVSSVAAGFQAQAKCFENSEAKRQLFSPIVSVTDPQVVTAAVERWTCGDIQKFVAGKVDEYERSIEIKKRNQQEYEKGLARGIAPQIAAIKTPEDQRVLTDRERSYLASPSRVIRQNPQIFDDIAKSVNEVYACYTWQAKAEMVCKITASLLTAERAVFLALDPKARALVSALSKKWGREFGIPGAMGISDAPGATQVPFLRFTRSESQKLQTPMPKLAREILPIEHNLETSEIVKREASGGTVNGVKYDKQEITLSDGSKVVGGANQTEIVTLSDGTKAVWKPHSDAWNSNDRAEVLAYEVSQKFGFRLVPPTVERTIDGRRGSLQLFKASQAKKVGKGFTAFDSRATEGLTLDRMELKKQSLFDYLIDNRDRHQSNWLVSPEGRVVSIDNGNSFTAQGSFPVNYEARRGDILDFAGTSEGQQIVARIRAAVADPVYAQNLQTYLGTRDATRMLERMRHFLQDIPQ